MAPLTFYFDYISPYAYVGWHLAQRIAKDHGRELVAEPILFAALLNAHGTKGPAEIPAKRGYTFKDAFRKTHAAGLGPLVPPPGHPFNPLVALRATGLVPQADRPKAITALYAATWAGGGGIETAEAVARVLDAAGLDGASLVERAGGAEAKASLKKHTDEALALGVFGVPTLVADGELFWGVDGMGFAGAFLEGRDPVPEDALSRWADLPASATRSASK